MGSFLYRLAGFAEPGGFFYREMGGEGIEDALMVVVEPLDFLLGHHLDENGGFVDGTEGERLELEELAEFCLLVGYDQQSVLCAGNRSGR